MASASIKQLKFVSAFARLSCENGQAVTIAFTPDEVDDLARRLEKGNRKLAAQIGILDQELRWCIENPDPAFPAKYRQGFIAGLIQAKYLLTEAAEPHTIQEGGAQNETQP